MFIQNWPTDELTIQLCSATLPACKNLKIINAYCSSLSLKVCLHVLVFADKYMDSAPLLW